MNDFTASVVTPGITRIMGVGQVYMYLIEGTERALLIDTGYGYGDLNAFIHTLTDLPFDVVCTHGHVDHAGGAYGFERVWLNNADWNLAKEHTSLETRCSYLQAFGPLDPEKLLPARSAPWEPLRAEQTFDLGGCVVTALPLPGHTHGTMAMLIEPQKMLLLGDGCNSGTFLFFDHSYTVEAFRNSLLEMQSWEGRYQSVLFSHPHNYGGKEVVEQSITLCNAILEGTDDKVPNNTFGSKQVRIGKRMLDDYSCIDGSCANIWYDVTRIR